MIPLFHSVSWWQRLVFPLPLNVAAQLGLRDRSTWIWMRLPWTWSPSLGCTTWCPASLLSTHWQMSISPPEGLLTGWQLFLASQFYPMPQCQAHIHSIILSAHTSWCMLWWMRREPPPAMMSLIGSASDFVSPLLRLSLWSITNNSSGLVKLYDRRGLCQFFKSTHLHTLILKKKKTCMLDSTFIDDKKAFVGSAEEFPKQEGFFFFMHFWGTTKPAFIHVHGMAATTSLGCRLVTGKAPFDPPPPPPNNNCHESGLVWAI